VSVLVALVTGLVVWIVLWAFGVKGVDSFMITIALVVAAATYELFAPFLRQLLGREQAAPDQLGPPGAPGS
jgi:predicted PurR-regulated permease PerM